MRRAGKGIIYITHKLEEIPEIADRVTVLRDGRRVATAPARETPIPQLIQLMVGRDLKEMFPTIESILGDEVLRAEHLTVSGVLHDVSLTLRAGEIVGVAGLVGSGRTELAKALVGALPITNGVVFFMGQRTRIKSPEIAVRKGLKLSEYGLFDAKSGELIVARTAGGQRERPERVRLEADAGIPGDAWGRQQGRAITAMEFDVAELIANGQPLALFGDNFYLTLDLSTDNLPAGSRVRVGGAVLEVTAMPHNGCRKFRARFGADALQFVSKTELRHRNLRGIYMRTVEGGEIAPGDPVEVIARAPLPASDAKPRS